MTRRSPRTSSPTTTGARAPSLWRFCLGTGAFQQRLDDEHIDSGRRTQPPLRASRQVRQNRFGVDLADDTVSCPAGVVVPIRRRARGDGIAYFAEACIACPLRAECTDAAGGRTIRVNEFEAALAVARQRQAEPDW
ncbi:MAG: transposase [Actinomycetota bacterium]|nr:transposase [Actinomycetota bacterium]